MSQYLGRFSFHVYRILSPYSSLKVAMRGSCDLDVYGLHGDHVVVCVYWLGDCGYICVVELIRRLYRCG